MNAWNDLARLLNAAPGDYSLCVCDADGQQWYGYREHVVRSAASLIKVPLAITVVDRCQPRYGTQLAADGTIPILAGDDPLATILEWNDADRVEGAGPLDLPAAQHGAAGSGRITIRELLTHALTQSDNTASNLLIDLAGYDSVNTWLAQFGPATRLRRKFMDFDALAAGRDNTTTAADMCAILRHVIQPRYVEVLNLLRRAVGDGKLEAGLPPGTTIAHKVGDLPRAEHDAGIVFAPNNLYIVAALAVEVNDIAAARATIAEASRQVWEVMRG